MRRVALLLLLALAAPLAAAADPDLAGLQTRAKAGDAEAEFRLGEAYRTGQGVTGSLDTAIEWFRKAADQGHVRASEELGFTLFANGARREAMPYIEKAAARGEPRAFYLLGTAHFNGDYATRDWPLAYAQTTRAASAGLSAAEKNLALMDKYMLPTDRAKAEEILATLPPVRRTPPEPEALAATDTADSKPARAPAAKKAKDAAKSKEAKPKPISSPETEQAAAPSETTESADAKPAKASAGKKAKDARHKPDTETAADDTPPVPAKTKTKTEPADDADAKPAKAAEASGKWKIQLGAFGSSDRIDQRWKAMTAKVPRIRKLEKRVVPGKVQRLLAAGLASKADAEALCKDVHAAGGDCLVLAP